MSMFSFLAETFEGKTPKRPSFASAEKESGHDKDDHDKLHHVPSAKLLDHDLAGTAMGIEYIDMNENQTRRWVTIVSFVDDSDGQPSVLCHCFMRDNLRIFRVDRIINVFDNSGDSHDVRQFLHVEGHVSSSKNASRTYRASCRDGLRVLIAVARSDGHLDPREVDGILDYAKSEAHRLGVESANENLDDLRHYIERMQPSGSVVASCLKRLGGKDKATQDALLKHLELIIYADGNVASEEEDLSKLIHDRLHA